MTFHQTIAVFSAAFIFLTPLVAPAAETSGVSASEPADPESLTSLEKLYGELEAYNLSWTDEVMMAMKERDREAMENLAARKSTEYDGRIPELVTLAKAVPETDLARDAALLALSTSSSGDQRDGAIDLLVAYHIKSPKMDEAIANLDYSGRRSEICHAILATNSDPSVVAHARFVLAKDGSRVGVDKEKAKGDLRDIVRTGQAIESHVARGPQAGQGLSISDSAAQVLARIAANEAVKVGDKIFPFEGIDLNGEKVSIEDYRGKVTLVVFWATWCAPCLKMTELERRLVERYEGTPFEILGVCCDDELGAHVQKVAAHHKMTWKSIHNVMADGSRLSEMVGANGLPHCILLDRNGVVVTTTLSGGGEGQAAEFHNAIEKVLPEFSETGK